MDLDFQARLAMEQPEEDSSATQKAVQTAQPPS